MRLNRIAPLFVRLSLLFLAVGSLHAAVIVTLSAVPSTLTSGQSASLVALVTGATNAGVQWTFTPATTTGATIGPAAGPDSTGKSTNFFKAPVSVPVSFKVVVTVTSVQDAAQSDTATITVNPSVDVGLGAPT